MMIIYLSVYFVVAWKGGRRMAANTGISSYQNPGGSAALTLQATITTAHGMYVVHVLPYDVHVLILLIM